MKPRILLGRLVTGLEAGSGRLVHVTNDDSWQALCGQTPGPRSAGWADAETNIISCEKCLKAWRKAFLEQTLGGGK